MDEEQRDVGALYPDLYRRMEPYAEEAVELYGDGELDEDALGKMTRYVVSKSDFRRYPPPAYHNDRTIDEVARWLILNGLRGDYYDDYCGYYPYSYPIYPYPVYPRPIYRGGGYGYRGRGGFRGGGFRRGGGGRYGR